MRKGMMLGRGKGYNNVIPRDRPVHQDSGRGIKQPQRINVGLIRREARDLLDRKAILDAQFLLNKIPKDEYLAKVKHLRGEKEYFVKKITKRIGDKKITNPNRVPDQMNWECELCGTKFSTPRKLHYITTGIEPKCPICHSSSDVVKQSGKAPRKIYTVADLDKRSDLEFESSDNGTQSIRDNLGEEAQEYDSFFIKVEQGGNSEVWGMKGSVPELDRPVRRLQ